MNIDKCNHVSDVHTVYEICTHYTQQIVCIYSKYRDMTYSRTTLVLNQYTKYKLPLYKYTLIVSLNVMLG